MLSMQDWIGEEGVRADDSLWFRKNWAMGSNALA